MSLTNSLYGEKKETIHLQADATSLADLKAEMVRKKAEALQNRQKGNYRPEKKGGDGKKANIWSKENTGILARMHKDMENEKEEEMTWQRSKSIMERKAKIYASLKEGKGRSEIASNFLVEFGKKSDSDSDSDDGRKKDYKYDYPADGEDDEWVEYTDSLGRTRTCMRKDLIKLQQKDKKIEPRERKESSSSEDDIRNNDDRDKSNDEPDMLSEDMRREMIRQKWEKEEMENLTKDSLHYTDVRFDEARAHGAGFYAFSKDEQTRLKEQVTLKKLHEETDNARLEKERKAEKRKREMADRIWKIKQKRREKLGLPPLEDEPPKADTNGDEDSEQGVDFTKSVVDGLKMFRKTQEEEEKRKNEIKRRENLRDWDLGKDGLDDMKKEWKVLTQQEWLSKQRLERNPDFAPPTAFNEAKNILKKKDEEYKKNAEMKRQKSKAENFKTFSEKPSTSKNSMQYLDSYNNSNETHNVYQNPRASSNRFDPMAALEAKSTNPMAALEAESTNPMAALDRVSSDPMASLDKSSANECYMPSNIYNVPPPSYNVPPPSFSKYNQTEETKKPPTASGYSTAMRLDLHRKMQESSYLPQPGLNRRIINELEEQDSDSEDNEEVEAPRGRRNEIAPPCDMEYFNNTEVKNKNKVKISTDMRDSFAQGLQARKK